ncbi:hypothetical protein JMUB7520_27460 [Staphylococcus aureus]
MTNKQLAEMLEISSAYLSDILRGRRDAFEQKKRIAKILEIKEEVKSCLLYTSPSPRDYAASRMPSSA